MYHRNAPIRTLLCFLSVATGASLAAPGGGAKASSAKASHTKVDLLSSVRGVTPGVSFELGLRFRVDEGWHIYWKNGGDAGIPPQVTWTLPAGFKAGVLRFPVPKRRVDAGDVESNILEGQPVLLVTMTAPESLSGETVEMVGEVKYLVCDKLCLRERSTVRLALPVHPPGQEPTPAHRDVFAAAHKALPLRSSKYVSLTPSVTTESFAPNAKFDLILDVKVARGHHIQSNTPSHEAFVKCEVFLDRTAGFDFARPVYPKPTLRRDKVLGKLSEYHKRFAIRVPGEVWEQPKDQPVHFGGIFKYQACTATGRCYPPEAVSFSLLPGNDKTASTIVGSTRNSSRHAGTGGATGDATGATLAGQTPRGREGASVSMKTPTPPSGPTSLLGWLAFAFLGGLILNVMPCVLPVISIKVLSLVQQASEEPRKVVKLGLTFCAGIIVSFLALAFIIIAMKSAGARLGWGFQFQSPTFVIAMMSAMFVFGLSLLGVFTITLPGATVTRLSVAEQREGYLGAFLKGMLGTILATPCTAPFLGPALGVAFATTNDKLLLIFFVVGLGMASPFALLSMKPAWLRFLPKPGLWMEHFKQLMGFLLMGTVVWLMFVLGHQIGADGLVWTGAFLVFLAFACWLLGKQTPATPAGRRIGAWSAALIVVVAGWWTSFERGTTIAERVAQRRLALKGERTVDVTDIGRSDFEKHIPWQPWSKGLARQLASRGYTVYVDYTAIWCATCLANKKATLETKLVRAKMGNNCVIPLEADFSLEDPEILDELLKFDRSGVPLNVIYPAGKPDEPIVLPEQLIGRVGLVVGLLDKAGPSLTCHKSQTAMALSSDG